MDTKRLSFCLLLTLPIWSCALGQSGTMPPGALYQIWAEKQAEFALARQTTPDEQFFAEGGSYAHFQRWYRTWEPRLSPHGDMSIYDRVIGSYWGRQHQHGGERSNGDPWHEIGPVRRRNNMVGIGPIRSISISDVNSDHMLCTSSSGGVFYTTNAGTDCTWQNAGSDYWPTSGCQNAVYYPGTTDQWFAISSYDDGRVARVGGVLRKQSSNAMWDDTPVGNHADFGGYQARIEKLLFDKKLNSNQDHRLFVTSNRGVFYTDTPTSIDPAWELVQIEPPQSVYDEHPGATFAEDQLIVNDIEYLKQVETNTLCAAIRFALHEGGALIYEWRILISIDNGINWTEAPNHPEISAGVQWVGLATSSATSNLFYCELHSYADEAVLRFDPTQASIPWEQVVSYNHFADDIFGRANAFAVDNFNSTSILVGRTRDVEWFVNNQRVQYNGTAATAGYHTTGHDDTEHILAHPTIPGLFWVAHHGGVSLVTTSGNDRDWVDRSDGLGVAEVWSMSTSQNKPDYISLGLYHDCNAITRTPYVDEWSPDWAYQGLYGDGTLSIINHKDANVVYIANQGGQWERNDFAETSNESNEAWFVNSQYFKKGALNRKRPTNLYNVVFVDNKLEIERSWNKGETRIVVSNFTENLEINHPTIDGDEKFFWVASNPANSNHFYVSLNNWDWQKRIFRNTDIDNPNIETVKTNWVDVPHPRRAPLGSGGQDREPEVMAIAFHPDNANEIYIAYAASAFPSAQEMDLEYAQHMVYRMDVSNLEEFPSNTKFQDCADVPCEDITMNLPNSFMHENSMAYEQGSNGGLYVAMESGVYFTNASRIAMYDPDAPESADNMENSTGWVRIGDNLPHVVPAGLEINYQVNRIRVGTTGRGVWEHDLFCPTVDNYSTAVTHAPADFVEMRSSITSSGLVELGSVVNYRAGQMVELLPGFRASAGSRFHAFIHPCDSYGNSLSPKSLPVSEASETPDIGMNKESTLRVMPNPNNGRFVVEFSVFALHTPALIELYDGMGKLVESSLMSNTTHEFDLRQRKGLYTVIVRNAGSNYTQRVLITP